MKGTLWQVKYRQKDLSHAFFVLNARFAYGNIRFNQELERKNENLENKLERTLIFSDKLVYSIYNEKYYKQMFHFIKNAKLFYDLRIEKKCIS